jgi:hypothetical protein
MRIRSFYKHGLGYFEPIINTVKKSGNCKIDLEEFNKKLELAKPTIADVYR